RRQQVKVKKRNDRSCLRVQLALPSSGVEKAMKSAHLVPISLLLTSIPAVGQPGQPVRPTPTRSAPAEKTAPAQQLPIREITVFKDGHDLVIRSGPATFDAQGVADLDAPPNPVLGTFWAFA